MKCILQEGKGEEIIRYWLWEWSSAELQGDLPLVSVHEMQREILQQAQPERRVPAKQTHKQCSDHGHLGVSRVTPLYIIPLHIAY